MTDAPDLIAYLAQRLLTVTVYVLGVLGDGAVVPAVVVVHPMPAYRLVVGGRTGVPGARPRSPSPVHYT